MVTSSSVFLHTIPEDSSNVGGASSSVFDPAAVASATSPTGSSSNNNNNSPWAMMRGFRHSGNNPNAPPRSPSVTSSTNGVQAGLDDSGVGSSDGCGGGGGGYSGALDGSNNAVRAGDEERGSGPSSTVATNLADLPYSDHYETDPTAAQYDMQKKNHSRGSHVTKKRFLVVCGLAVLLIMAVALVLGLIVNSISRGDDDQLDSEEFEAFMESFAPSPAVSTVFPSDDMLIAEVLSMDTEEPTDEPSGVAVGLTLVHLEEAIYRLYNDTIPSVSHSIFTDYTDPRYQARAWLLQSDTYLESTIAEMTASGEGIDKNLLLESIAQRYIMTVFYFSTLNNLTSNTNSVTISGNNRNRQRQRRLDKQAEDSIVFELQPDVHECYWLENACGQDGASEVAAAEAATMPTEAAAAAEARIDDNINVYSSIVYLNASTANLAGTLPFELGYLSDLREFAIPGNQIQGTIPDYLCQHLESLYLLDLSKNLLTGTVPASVWTLPTLRFAYLHRNQLTGSIPQMLPAAPSADLEGIWLRDNQLTGEIPGWWTELSLLENLSISGNEWTGRLPTNWSQASKLEFLDASWNQLTGPVPYDLLYSAPSLKFLYLENNQLTGTLMTSDKVAENAELEFTISLGRSNSRLEAVWLQFNQLTGTIPAGFGKEWWSLRQLELQGNELTGIWQCQSEGANLWPSLEELTVDCFQGVSLTETTTTSSLGGLDMSQCSACCVKCF